MGQKRGHRIRLRPVQHKDASLRQDLAQGDTFGQPRHKKGIAAGLRQGGRDGGSAQAIGIGLDHGGHRAGPGHAAIGAIIGGDGTKAHGQPRGFEILPHDPGAHGRRMAASGPRVH